MAESTTDYAYSVEEKYFHDLVRDWVISLLVFLMLLSASYAILLLFRREPEKDDFTASDKEDTAVYQAAFLICVFTLSASFSCTLLLPASVACNEILLMYPDSYYLQWINGSLVSKLWDLTFYFSRALIFILLPFIYLFTEAIGFMGMRQGVMARIYEVVTVMILVGFVIFGLFFLSMALVYSYEDILISDVWICLDRLITSIGFILLLISTPIGYAAVFKSSARRSLPFLQRRPQVSLSATVPSNNTSFTLSSTAVAERSEVLIMEKEVLLRKRRPSSSKCSSHNNSFASANGDVSMSPEEARLEKINKELQALEHQLDISTFGRVLSWISRRSNFFHLLSPLLSAFLAFGLAGLSTLSTAFTVLERVLTSRTLENYDEKLRLGHESLSRLGIFGSSLGLVLQLSCAIAALVGLYSLPLLNTIFKPVKGDTPMTRVILNCAVWILLAQAFPTFSSCLGLTNFQLLSGFRSASNWLLSSTLAVVIIDVIYIAFVVLHLVNSLTAPLVTDFVAFIVARWQRFRSGVTSTPVVASSEPVEGIAKSVRLSADSLSAANVTDSPTPESNTCLNKNNSSSNNNYLTTSPTPSSFTVNNDKSNNSSENVETDHVVLNHTDETNDLKL